MYDYSKHKERSPQDTVYEIQRILKEAGIFTVMEWTSKQYEGAVSNRIYLYPLKSLGQNGKGTDMLYASASGYAELMERMQNNWLGQRLQDEALDRYAGFFEFPDEKLMGIEELIAQEDPFLKDLLIRLGCFTKERKVTLLQTFAKEYYHREDGLINVIPYVDLFEDRVVWLPFAVITLFGLSNGMTAGNTMEEALVQGFSELYERHVHKKLLENDLTPPEIPRDVLRQYSFYKLIDEIERDGRYRVSVRDCSLGEGYPVSCVIISDLQTGTFGMKPGCHPSFAVSVERTLTEAFQGKKLDFIARSNYVGNKDAVTSYHNTINVAKIGLGAYPPSLLAGKEGWEYRPWTEWEGLSNRDYLQKLISHAREHGYRPLIRDSSHMGFPSFHIIIPGISDIYPVTGLRLRDFWTQLKSSRALQHFPDLSQEEEERLLTFCRFKDSSVEFSMGIPFMSYITGKAQSPERIEGWLAMKRGEYAVARTVFARLAGQEEEGSEEWTFLRCLVAYAGYRMAGLSAEEAHRQLFCRFQEETARKVSEITRDDEGILQRAFPQKRKCFDCAHCELAGSECEYPEAKVLYRKIKDAMAKSTVSVDALRERLHFLTVDQGRS